MDEPSTVDVWHAVHGDTIRELLRRAHEGEDPDLLYIEFYANGEEPEDAEG